MTIDEITAQLDKTARRGFVFYTLVLMGAAIAVAVMAAWEWLPALMGIGYAAMAGFCFANYLNRRRG